MVYTLLASFSVTNPPLQNYLLATAGGVLLRGRGGLLAQLREAGEGSLETGRDGEKKQRSGLGANLLEVSTVEAARGDGLDRADRLAEVGRQLVRGDVGGGLVGEAPLLRLEDERAILGLLEADGLRVGEAAVLERVLAREVELLRREDGTVGLVLHKERRVVPDKEPRKIRRNRGHFCKCRPDARKREHRPDADDPHEWISH